MDKNWNLLVKKAAEFNMPLNDSQLDQFKDYWQFLDEYNKHTNLVSNTDQEFIIIKHFVDSLSLGLLKDTISLNTDINFIDIGIGGGFPGIPLLIANPEWKLCAVDSIGKKTKFIELLAEKLDLSSKIEIITARAEDVGSKQDKREKFDLVISRAVSQLSTLAEYCLPFIKKDGIFAAYKAKDIDTEIKQAQNALSILGGRILNTISYELPEDKSIERKLIIIEKFRLTPLKYPRKAGFPKKYPL